MSSEEGVNSAYTPEGLDASDVEPAIKIWPSNLGMLEKQLAESHWLTGEEACLVQTLRTHAEESVSSESDFQYSC